MNLHAIIHNSIGSINRHEPITLYKCTGTSNRGGVVSVTYEKQTLTAQVQAPEAADLRLYDNMADAKHVKKFYIPAPASTINRFEETAGDIIERVDGSYWLIDAIRDDFSNEGWVCCLATLQHEPPEGIEGEGDGDAGS